MKLLERLDRAGRLAHLARSTRQQYCRWVGQFLRFHRAPGGRWRTPAELRGADVAAFLTHMAADRRGVHPARARRGLRPQRGVRWHTTPAHVSRTMAAAARAAGIAKRVTPHALRHPRTCWSRGGTFGRCSRCWGHASLETTMIYTHVMNRPAAAVTSPLDRLVAG